MASQNEATGDDYDEALYKELNDSYGPPLTPEEEARRDETVLREIQETRAALLRGEIEVVPASVVHEEARAMIAAIARAVA